MLIEKLVSSHSSGLLGSLKSHPLQNIELLGIRPGSLYRVWTLLLSGCSYILC